MKATLRFDLDDCDDAAAFRRCAKATDAYLALYQIREYAQGEPDILFLDYILNKLDDLNIDLDDLP